jgi:carbonic anhydrase/acetyltransferase-like protein (isoleucine patch superfamily)
MTRNMASSSPPKPSVVDPTAYIAPGAHVIGDVTIGAESSVWFNSVLRSEGEVIRVGRQTNIQDLCVLHVDIGRPCRLGDRVSVGHAAIVHGAIVEDDVLIGMRAVILNNVRIGSGSVVAAGAVIPEGTEIPPGSIVMGVPARVQRAAESRDRERIDYAWRYYVDLARAYKEGSE